VELLLFLIDFRSLVSFSRQCEIGVHLGGVRTAPQQGVRFKEAECLIRSQGVCPLSSARTQFYDKKVVQSFLSYSAVLNQLGQ
jgi:hypothetical protein